MQIHVKEFFELLSMIWPILVGVALVWMRLETRLARIETALRFHLVQNGKPPDAPSLLGKSLL